MPNWRQKHLKYKGRVALRGDLVKDDSGSYAVFTEQGPSASQMTAAKVMDIISRLPGCAGQAADAVSACTQVKMEDAPKLFKSSLNRNVQTFGFVYHDTNGQNHGPVWKIQWFLLNEICTVILWKDCYGKGNLRKSYWNTFGRKFPIGNAYSYTVKKDSSYLCMWMTSNWLERNKTLTDVESTQQRSWFGRTNMFLWSCILGLYSKTMWNKQRYCRQLENHVWIQNFRRSNWKITMLGNSEYLFMVLWHGRSCQEMCGTILWVGELNDSTTLQSIHSMHRWPPLQRRRIEIRGRIVKSMLSDCSEMLILGTYWKTWYSTVSEQTCTIDHTMDQSVWQTIISLISYITCDYKQCCHVGNTAKTMQIGTVSRLRICRRSWGFKIYIMWNIVHFRKPYVCWNQLDV